MSRALRQGSDYYKMRDGAAFPLRWSAPELLATDGSRCTSASDVWSFFVLMWEVWSRAQVPFGAKSGILVSMILEDVREGIILPGTILDQPSHANSALYHGLQDLCWVVSPDGRASFAQLCAWIGDQQVAFQIAQPVFTPALDLDPTAQHSAPYQAQLGRGARPYHAAGQETADSNTLTPPRPQGDQMHTQKRQIATAGTPYQTRLGQGAQVHHAVEQQNTSLDTPYQIRLAQGAQVYHAAGQESTTSDIPYHFSQRAQKYTSAENHSIDDGHQPPTLDEKALSRLLESDSTTAV